MVDELVVETVATFLRFADRIASVPDESVVACDEHRALAREAAVSSMVLLDNGRGLLPADPSSLGRVAVLGRLAAVANLGDQGSSNVLAPEVVTPLDGLRAALPEIEVVHADDDASLADGADLVVVVVGYTKADEGEYIDQAGMAPLMSLFPPIDHPELGLATEEERNAAVMAMAGGGGEEASGVPAEQTFSEPGGDRRSLRLRAEDEALIEDACAHSDRVVVAVMGGSAVVAPWLGVPAATLLIWYPGMEGGHALADVLVGRAEPGGRLPFTMAASEDDLVDFDPDATTATYGLLHGQWKLDADGVEATRPFGSGLGYTTFRVDDARLAEREPTIGRGPALAVDVANTGNRGGSTVVQVYASVPDSAYERPPRRLRGIPEGAPRRRRGRRGRRAPRPRPARGPGLGPLGRRGRPGDPPRGPARP
ncbi:MAG: glycoside hydrolase family 3 C-terminal domain-containing protein [Acidimicrobiia bacterium]|nr:glycoside hydrolase family 3 C-terminal domain-containing protein [Acidimicrobiia bacterium]